MKFINLIFCFLLLNFITAQSVTFRCMEAEIFAKGCPTCDNSRTGKMITGIELNITGTKTEFINPCVVKYDSLDNISIIDYRNVVKTFKRTQTAYASEKALLKALGKCTTPDGAPAIDTLQYINDTLGISLYGDSVAMYKVRISPTAVIRFDTIKYENDTLYLSLENDGEAVHKLKISSGTTQTISISSGKGTISLTSGGSVTLNDSSATNEIQDLSFASKSGTTNTLNITNGSGVKIKDGTGITVSRDSANQITITNNGYARFDTAKYANDTLTLSIENDGQAAYKFTLSTASLPFRLTFNSVANANALVTDASIVSNWNTYFNLPTNGTAFTSVQIVGTEIRLFGGANITLKTAFLYNNANIIKVIDDAGCIVSAVNFCFYSCSNLTTLYLPKIKSVGDSFCQQSSTLTDINVPSLSTAGGSVFMQCSALTSIDVQNITTVGIQFAFGNSLLTKINAPNLTFAGTSSFGNCTALATISLPKLLSAGASMFQNGTSLTSVDISSCTNLGGSVGNNSVFSSITGKTITLTVPSSLMTCNSGSPDGDISTLQSNNTVTIKQISLSPQKIDTFLIVNDTIRLSLQEDGEVYKNVSLKNYLQTVDTFRVSGGNLELSLSNDGAARSQLAVTQIAPVQNIKAGNNVTISGTDTVTINATGVTDGDKGDIDVTSSGSVWSLDTNSVMTIDIQDKAVTYAKIQDVAANSILARSTSTSGAVSELAIGNEQLVGRSTSGNLAPISTMGLLQWVGNFLNVSATSATLQAVQTGGVNWALTFLPGGAFVTFTQGDGIVFSTTNSSKQMTITARDTSATNELQSLSFATKSGTTNTLNISNGTGVKIKDGTGITITRDSANQITINNSGTTSLKDTAYYFPENYGAVVNDTIDDRAAIQQAIDSACARGGGIVWLRKGEYRIKTTAPRGTYESGLHLCSNVHLMGTGYGSVITNKVATAGRHIVSLQHNGTNMTLQDFQIKSDSLPSGAAVYSDTTVSNVVINHVKIDRGTCWGVFLKNAELSTITNSDIQNNGGCHCVELNNASRNTVKNNWLYSNATKDYWPSRGNGVEVFYDRTETIRPYSNNIEGNNIWGTGGGVVVWGDSLTTINNNIIRTVEGHGMVVKRQDDALPYYPSIGTVITGNIIYGTGYANNSSLGILVDYDSRDVLINGNKLDTIQSEYAPAGGGVGMEIRASGTVINNNSVRHCSVNGISITSDADYCTVTGNNIIDVSILLENGYKGISCSGDRCTINSNNVHDLRGTHRMDVCIYVPGNDCVITGNNASGAATGDAIYCPGTGNVEANNKE